MTSSLRSPPYAGSTPPARRPEPFLPFQIPGLELESCLQLRGCGKRSPYALAAVMRGQDLTSDSNGRAAEDRRVRFWPSIGPRYCTSILCPERMLVYR